MKQSRRKIIVFLMIILLTLVYGVLIPIIPLGKFLFLESKVVRLYPYDIYLLKYLPNEEIPDFSEYMKKDGWIYLESVESGYLYKKGNSKKYIHMDNFISVYINKSNVKIWHSMTTILEWSKSVFYIMLLVYALTAFVFIIFIIRLGSVKEKC